MSYYQNDSPGYGGGGGNRKRGRDFDDDAGSSYGGGQGHRRQQRRFNDYDQPIAPYGGRDYSGMGGGGGGRRGRGRGGPRYSNHNDRDYAFQALLSAGEKYSIDLWRFGDVIPEAKVDEASRFTENSANDLQGIADETKDLWAKGSKEDVLRAFRIAVAECPHKLPYFATILSLLANEEYTPPPARIPAKPLVTITNSSSGDSSTTNGNGNTDDNEMQAVPNTPAPPQPVNIGLEITKDLVKVFQNHLDARRWRGVRFCLHMFAHLATLPKPLISITSLLSLLNQSFIFVLENEFSLRAERGDELVKVVLETLIRLPAEKLQGQDEALDAIKSGLSNYMNSRELDLSFLGDKVNEQQWLDPLQQLYEAFMSSSGEALPTLSRPYEQFSHLSGSNSSTTEDNDKEQYTVEPFSLPVISLPIDTDEDTVPTSGKLPGSARPVATTAPGESDDWAREPVGYSGVRVQLAFFLDETVPARNSNNGLYLRQLMVDLLNVYEVNRKDCARILLNDLPKWLPAGTFKPAAPAANAARTAEGENDNGMVTEESTIMKENSLMDVILSQMLATPSSPQRSIYYYSLITELCKLSPSTVAPALGKCIRKLYAGLGLSDAEAGPEAVVLGPEGIRRYSDWMATHLSNFGFHWRWPEWQGDLTLPATHPKKIFIARVLDLETRLSYHERIKSTLPEDYLSSSAGVFPSEAPAPDFTYEAEGPSSYQSAASEVLNLMRSKATSSEIKEALDRLKAEFIAGEIGDEPIDEEAAERRARDILFQCILVIGSRSFSHYLNILERYIVILRETTNSTASRSALLRSASRFWSKNSLFRHIVFDKLLQYRIVDPIDVINFVFEGEEPVLDGEITTRDWSDISIWEIFRMTLEKVQNRVLAVTLRLENLKKREENRIDTERAAAGEMKTDENDDATTANAEGEPKITDEQAQIEVSNVEKQVDAVKKEQESLFVDVVKKWQDTLVAIEGSEDPWSAWFAKGWFSEFCRAFAVDLTRQMDALARVELSTDGIVYQGLAGAQRWVEFV